MNHHPAHHWFLERWCAELVVEDLLPAQEVARRMGVSEFYVRRAVRAVNGCTVLEARARARRKFDRLVEQRP